jgi:hypothetical protein
VKQSSLADDAFVLRTQEIAENIVTDRNGRKYYVLQTERATLTDPVIYFLTDTLAFSKPTDEAFCNGFCDLCYSARGALFVGIADADNASSLTYVKEITTEYKDSSFQKLQLIDAHFPILITVTQETDSGSATVNWQPYLFSFEGNADYCETELYSIYTDSSECKDACTTIKIWAKKKKVKVKKKINGPLGIEPRKG